MTIKPYEPKITYHTLVDLVMQQGGQAVFMEKIRVACRQRNGLIIVYNTETYWFTQGFHYFTLRLVLPKQYHNLRVYSEPLDLFVARPVHPEQQESWIQPWPYEFVNNEWFKMWIKTCTRF